MDRDAILAETESLRQRALTVPCVACDAGVGEACNWGGGVDMGPADTRPVHWRREDEVR